MDNMDLKGKFACRLCRHDQHDHNFSVGCPHCRCMATPIEASARNDAEELEILPADKCLARYEPKQPMEEPRQIGLQVRDRLGKVWTRYHTAESGNHWWSNSGGGWKRFADLRDPEPYTDPVGAENGAQPPVGTMQRRIYARDLLTALTTFIECEPRLHKEEHAALDLLAKTTLPEYIEGGF